MSANKSPEPESVNERDDHKTDGNIANRKRSKRNATAQVETSEPASEPKPKRSKASAMVARKKAKITKEKEKKLLLKRKKATQRKAEERSGWVDAFMCKRCTDPGYPGYLLFQGKDTLGRHTKRKHDTSLPYNEMETIPWEETKGWRYAKLKKFGVSEGVKP